MPDLYKLYVLSVSSGTLEQTGLGGIVCAYRAVIFESENRHWGTAPLSELFRNNLMPIQSQVASS
jgi:hypothetical protein